MNRFLDKNARLDKNEYIQEKLKNDLVNLNKIDSKTNKPIKSTKSETI